MALIDSSSGALGASYYYDAFGDILEQTGAVESPILYAGYQYDPETGLYYLNARMYDPKIARFLQEDTYRGSLNDPLSLHLYAYCFNNPLRYFDPTGHMGAAIRAAEEALGNTVAWKAGENGAKSTITISGNGSTKTLVEGKDFTYGADGKAYYIENSSGKAIVETRKDTGVMTAALPGDIAPPALPDTQGQAGSGSAVTIKVDGETVVNGTILTGMGVTAVVVGTTVLTGGAGLPAVVLVAAGVTTTAGAGATVMGTSEIVSGFTDCNWVKEHVFSGNEQAYELARMTLTLGSTLGTAYLSPYYAVIQPGDIADDETANSQFVAAKGLGEKPLYRTMSEAELNAVKDTGLLRGGRPGPTYFTDSDYSSADAAKSQLALPTRPEYSVQFEIINNPRIEGGGIVQPAYGELGGGIEYFTNDPVQVKIISYHALK